MIHRIVLSVGYCIKPALACLALTFASLVGANGAHAQTIADLPGYGEVEPGNPLEIDGVWNVVGLGKRVLIEDGHSYVLDPWIHLFTIQVEKGQVVSTSIRRSGDSEYTAYDNLLQREMYWSLNQDGSISAKGRGFLAPSFKMEPIELYYPEAFEEAILLAGKQPAALGPPVQGKPTGRPGPLTQLSVGTYWLANSYGKCMDLVDKERTAQGGKIQLWDCKSNANQEWGYINRDRALVSGSGMCLEATGGKNGAAVKTYGCDGRPEQRWGRQKLSNGTYAFVSDTTGKCLDAAKSTAKKNGGRVIVWDCHYGATQSWKVKK